jgi:tripartite-type tricarboxylate transporter receptor subunit TctC
MSSIRRRALGVALGVFALATVASAPVAAWEPTKPIQFIVPAGTGGGADQMARFIQGVVSKH